MSTSKVPRALAGLILAVLTAASIGAASGPPQTGDAGRRAAVILGNGPAAADEPSAQQTARGLKGYELYKNGIVNTLVVTGGFTVDYISEARMLKIALVTYGVPPADIVEDEQSATTIENAVFSAKIFEAHGWPKKAQLVSQKYHLPRASANFKDRGFEVQDGVAADVVTAPADFGLVPDMKGEPAVTAGPSDLVVVYEPFTSLEAMDWPTADLARRLRIAASLYHAKAASAVVLYNDRYTRGPVNLAQMMKIALVSLGVPAANIKAARRGEYRSLGDLAASMNGKSATVLTTARPQPARPGPPSGVMPGPPPLAGGTAAPTMPAGATMPQGGAASPAPPPGGAAPAGTPPAGARPMMPPGGQTSLPANWKIVKVD
jgi:uncharacterized SAM-binding protein YcdF (DUF218 family)